MPRASQRPERQLASLQRSTVLTYGGGEAWEGDVRGCTPSGARDILQRISDHLKVGTARLGVAVQRVAGSWLPCWACGWARRWLARGYHWNRCGMGCNAVEEKSWGRWQCLWLEQHFPSMPVPRLGGWSPSAVCRVQFWTLMPRRIQVRCGGSRYDGGGVGVS